MPFGLAGLGTTWAFAAHHHQAPAFVAAVLMAGSFFLWFVLLSVYVRHAARRWRTIVDDLEDATTGPFTALVLLTPLLLIVGGLAGKPDVARPLFDVLTFLVLVLASWLTGEWIDGPLELDRLHPGYFLPAVAGGYTASGGAAALDQPLLAEVMFGVASLSWLVLGTLVLGRLMFRPALPAALMPTIAIEVAPPALASSAWFSLNGGRLDPVAAGLLGYGLVMLLAQLRLLPTYRKLTFTAGFWAFTLPVAAVGTSTLQWLVVTGAADEGAWSAMVLTVVTLPISLIGARTVVALLHGELRPSSVAMPTPSVSPGPDHARESRPSCGRADYRHGPPLRTATRRILGRVLPRATVLPGRLPIRDASALRPVGRLANRTSARSMLVRGA
jgi:tellurite resistance protein